MTKELRKTWEQITSDYLKMYNAGTLRSLPMDVQVLMHKMAMEMQTAVCDDMRAKQRALDTRRDNLYWRTR